MNSKFKLIPDDTITVWGRTLYRIEALKDFSDVKKGDKGGFIEKEVNLDFTDDSWIYDNSIVRNNSKICDNSKIRHKANIDSSVIKNSDIINSTIKYSNITDSAVMNSIVSNSKVAYNATCNEANIHRTDDLLVLYPIGNENSILTAYRDKKGGITIRLGFFEGSLESLEGHPYMRGWDNKDDVKVELAVIELIKTKIKVGYIPRS